jgi:Domain of unknown function (DUF3560)
MSEEKPKNSYEQRQQQRKERYEELAEKAGQESQAACQAAERISSFIPPGQPILVGHHSERKHRRDLERIDNNLRRAIEAQNKSRDYADKAASVGTAGISSDDPDAIEKLRAKLTELEEKHARMKAANKQAPGTYPGYSLQNNNAKLRRVRERIAQLEKSAARQTTETKLAGLTIRQDADENRMMLLFDKTPSPDIRTLCKRQGFKWSPSRNAWVRFLNNAGIHAAEAVSKAFAEQPPQAAPGFEQGRGEDQTPA